MKEKEPLPSDLKKFVLAIARLRLTHRNNPYEARRTSAVREINEIISKSPQLSTQRAIAFFPEDGHLEIAKKLLTIHRDLWVKREQDCIDEGLNPPKTMVSGEFFEIDGEKFLKLDTNIMSHEAKLKKLVEAGYTVLLPYFEVYSPASNTRVEL